MLRNEEQVNRIQSLLENDALYNILLETKNDHLLYEDDYLAEINEKSTYGTPKVASWFDIGDAQLRYYIKPFHNYLFGDEVILTDTVYRLSFSSILKLRMILLLKDEYKVKGIKRLIGAEGTIYRDTKPLPEDLTLELNNNKQRLEELGKIVQGITQSGMFKLVKDPESEETKILINEINLNKMVAPAQDELNNMKDLIIQKDKAADLKELILEKKLQRDNIFNQIDNLEGYIRIMKVKFQSEQSPGFWSKLFNSSSSNNSSSETDQLIKETESRLQKLTLQEQLLKSEIEELKVTLQPIHENIKKIGNTFSPAISTTTTNTKEE